MPAKSEAMLAPYPRAVLTHMVEQQRANYGKPSFYLALVLVAALAGATDAPADAPRAQRGVGAVVARAPRAAIKRGRAH